MSRDAAQSVSAESAKSFAFGGDSVIKMRAALDSNLHFPGDKVKCRLAVKNKSKKKIKGVVVTLKKTETLSAKGKTTSKTQVIHSARYGKASVAKGKSANLDLEFTLPANLYPTILSSELVKVEYVVDFRLDIPWAIDLHVAAPVVLLEEEGTPGGVNIATERSSQRAVP